jgi:DNA-binding IscR family transcriptional regulator
MVALEGPAALLDCMDVPNDCSLSGACAQRNVWRSVEDAVQGVLSSITVADLASQQRNMVSQIAHQVVVAV